jgi:hypothetical protein
MHGLEREILFKDRNLKKYTPPKAKQTGVRLLEFGCGAGVNLIFLMSGLEKQN